MPPISSLAAVLAQTPTPISVEWQGGLISFLLLTLVVLNIWDKLKPKSKTPPDHEVYATKNEVSSLELRLERKHGELSAQISAVNLTVQSGFRSLERSLGRAEGKLEEKEEHHGR